MAKLRKNVSYQKLERPYTRISKFTKKNYVRGGFPHMKVIKFDMGNLYGGKDQFPLVFRLVSKDLAQIRTNAIEAARTTALKRLEKQLGRTGFYFKILAVPHQMIRENPLAAGAGADRLSTGMKHSFGKIIGTACHVEVGKVLFEVYVNKEAEPLARKVLDLASKKLPVRTSVQMEVQKVKKLSKADQERIKASQEAEEKAIAERAAAKEAKEEAYERATPEIITNLQHRAMQGKDANAKAILKEVYDLE